MFFLVHMEEILLLVVFAVVSLSQEEYNKLKKKNKVPHHLCAFLFNCDHYLQMS